MLFGQIMATQPPGRQTRSISARPASPPWPGAGGGGEDRARDDQIGEAARDRQVVEKPVRHAGAVSMIGFCELPLQYLTQAGRGLNSHYLPPPVDELQRQAP